MGEEDIFVLGNFCKRGVSVGRGGECPGNSSIISPNLLALSPHVSRAIALLFVHFMRQSQPRRKKGGDGRTDGQTERKRGLV